MPNSELTGTLAVLKAWARGAALVLTTVTKQDGAAGALAEAWSVVQHGASRWIRKRGLQQMSGHAQQLCFCIRVSRFLRNSGTR